MKKTAKSLWTSALALVLCVSMLLGTTFAWFTDSVSSDRNTITAGNLDIELEYMKENGNWKTLNENTNVFKDAKWEPGYTEVVYLRITNAGELALKYMLNVAIKSEDSSVNKNGETFKLSEFIKLGTIEGVKTAYADRDTARDAVKDSAKGLREGYTKTSRLAKGEVAYVALVLYIPEEVGNEANHAKGASVPKIDLGINLVATQADKETDSFGDDYDLNATFPEYNANYTASTSVAGKVSNGALTEAITIGDTTGNIYASAPRGVKLATGASMLKLTVASMKNAEANVTATHHSEVLHSIDVHIDGVAEGNTVPMTVTLLGALPAGLNSNNVKLYHVENGTTTPMTLVDSLANHNEFTYDPATGDVVISIASFSEIALYGDTKSEWDGETVATGFNGGTGTEADPYIIANAEQFVYFRNAVDGGDTFEGKFVKLASGIDLNGKNFDPIGWGYEYDGFTPGGLTFNGTFDGDGHTVYGLYQNGWDLDPDQENYSNYTYSMAGGGLFASVVDATIKNLTISGADIVFECVDMGVLVGYAQGNCSFSNISIINCTIQNYNRYTGGVVGECSPRYDANGNPMHSNHVFEDITVDSTTVVSSLWGSFDTSLGGILGGKWDKNGSETKVTMRRCSVACQIDAFNDVTSAYQWYAYRRAGMLIGNSEQSESHKALASFLTCENVVVIYGSWNNYHYCEFTNQSGTEDAAWQNNYPWVRVEKGLSCNAYSNPRYGHPVVNGTPINSSHTHENGDECTLSIPFKQLYGGGQGVYGATEHDGVTEGAYTVTYKDGDKTIKVDVVAENNTAYTLWGVENYTSGGLNPEAWVDLNGVKITSIAAGNKAHYTVYAQWPDLLSFSLIDPEKNVLYSKEFVKGKDFTPNADEIAQVLSDLQNTVDSTGKTIEVSWETEIPENLKDATENVVIMAKYTIVIKGINATLKPKYNEAGELVGYQYTSPITSSDNTATNIEIPGYIGNLPIYEVRLAGDAFSGNEDLISIKLPANIDSIGWNAFENGPQGGITSGRSQIAIYYSGTAAQWQEYMDYIYKNNNLYKQYNQNTITIGTGEECLNSSWDNGLERGSRIFFLDENGKVDQSQGYWELYYEYRWGAKYTWVYHKHRYNEAHNSNCNYHNSVTTDYTDSQRGDSVYWTANEQ